MAKTRAGSAVRKAATSRPRVDELDRELETWRARVLPDASAPLDAEDIARLVRDCFASFGIDPAAGESFSVNTVHYYRRKDIIDEPEGRTSAARYTIRHLWQAVGARLAGFLGLVTLAEARDAFHGASEAALRRFVAERVADAHAREASRSMAGTRVAEDPRPLPGAHEPIAAAAHTAAVIPLGGNAMCLIPGGHAATRSPAAARALVDALAAALGLPTQ